MQRIFIVCSMVVSSGLVLNHALATPLHFNEAIDGDLPGVSSPLATLPLGIGSNTVVGSFGIDAASEDFDSFAFTVPGGAELLSGQVNLLDLTGNITSARWVLKSGSANYLGGTMLEFLDPPSPGLASIVSVPLGTGVYNLSAGSMQIAGPTPAFALYTFTFEVVAVPEPSSFILAAAGGAALLAVVARRAQRRRPAADAIALAQA